MTTFIIFWQVWRYSRKLRKQVRDDYSFFHQMVKEQRYYASYNRLHTTKKDRKYRSKTPMW